MIYQTHINKKMKTPEEIIERLNQLDKEMLDDISLFMEKKLIYEGMKGKSKESYEYIQMKQAKEIMRDKYIERSLLLWVLQV
jgi:hypothetical protein